MDNHRLPQRKSIRLKGYDYSQAGLYFITICCQDRVCRFGDVVNGEMVLNELGQIAHDEWIKLSNRFSNFEIDVFQIMPNHMHGIILLNNASVGAGFTPAQYDLDTPNNLDTPNESNIRSTVRVAPTQNDDIRATEKTAPTISDIVGAYKSLVFNGCLSIYKSKNVRMGKLWQRNYYEHIIRDEQSYQRISQYIINNPAKWAEDKFYKK